ncbi:CLUMA_CG014977, isoform A [Clunio marinus]|uniref:CLUMA_CG014977, isoform A n=1 Tax=Clunio marinus TaxID=568069 RepID=A0A1J1ITC6_9DIPT|nr:CLUMA_CG014977, isoform A [Clunio marinus]
MIKQNNRQIIIFITEDFMHVTFFHQLLVNVTLIEKRSIWVHEVQQLNIQHILLLWMSRDEDISTSFIHSYVIYLVNYEPDSAILHSPWLTEDH